MAPIYLPAESEKQMKTCLTCIGLSAFLAGGLFLGSPDSVSAADTLFKPFVSVSEEITDNVFELPANKRTEYITRLRPGATFNYKSPFWTWDSAYSFEYRNYARDTRL